MALFFEVSPRSLVGRLSGELDQSEASKQAGNMDVSAPVKVYARHHGLSM